MSDDLYFLRETVVDVTAAVVGIGKNRMDVHTQR